MTVITEAEKIFVKDFLGQHIGLGETLQIYRPSTIRRLKGTKEAEELTLPSAWYWGELQLNLEKGLVLLVHEIYHPNGVQEGELEITKIGWRIAIKKAKFVIFKSSALVKEDILRLTYAHATKIGGNSLKKHRLFQ